MKIVSGVKTIAVEYPNGKKEVLAFDANNADNLQAWTENAKAMKDVDFSNLENIDEIIDVLKSIFVSVYGIRTFNKFWKRTNKDLSALTQVISETSRLLKEAIDGLKKLGK